MNAPLHTLTTMADSRFSSRKEFMRHHPTVDYGDIEVPPAPPGEFLAVGLCPSGALSEEPPTRENRDTA